ncbi:RNA 2',3'-cyclic phosphodiesterase [Phenylobacterium sp.]|uniref:RNA 2',3'-cyclic phosphodiesterase n=1 Tax=Phenylobacterium sp. TaxID=1871053 RepID=UPI00286C0534|nr:RNA 2',3'-cyclic phosphodiesterase [Phenylobacterium sp.]
MIRLFAALSVPADIGAVLAARQDGLAGARWRPVEAFHITLRFFGDVAEDVAADLDAELAMVTGAPLALELEGVGAFDEGADIHAVWAGVAEDPALRHLARRCETAARRAGLRPDGRVYTPHVTMAYLRRPNPSDVAAWLADNDLLKAPSFRATSFGLYSSWRTDEGSRYRLEREYPLT